MNLKEYLDENRITYREFAEKLGIHLQSLKNIAYGKRKPSLGLALQIEEHTSGKVTPRDLIDEFNVPQTKSKRKSVRKQL
jgi:transcriptional regulator with XRE-family HTH domain